jgi:hypothetical protein
MTVASEPNEPNEAGYAGAASTPEPARTQESREDVEAEAAAVPAGDLTEPLTEAMEPGEEDQAGKEG